MKFKINHGASVIDGYCVYHRASFSLEFKGSLKPALREKKVLPEMLDEKFGCIKSDKYFVIADTLTLVFAGASKNLVSLDAYTNCNMWLESQNEELPSVIASGSLSICNEPEFSDRIDLKCSPIFQYSELGRWIKISLHKGNSQVYYSVGRNLLAGFECENLCDLILTNVTFHED